MNLPKSMVRKYVRSKAAQAIGSMYADRRRATMRAIKSKNTKPELIVRAALTTLGHSYRLHPRSVPGRPDIACSGEKKAIFVNGCFWHQHRSTRCHLRRLPPSNLAYWAPKLARNVERDAANLKTLKSSGWRVLVVWECELTNTESLTHRLSRFWRG